MPRRKQSRPKSRWVQVIEIGLSIQMRVKDKYVLLRGYGPDELIDYYLHEFGSILTDEEKTKLQSLKEVS